MIDKTEKVFYLEAPLPKYKMIEKSEHEDKAHHKQRKQQILERVKTTVREEVQVFVLF